MGLAAAWARISDWVGAVGYAARFYRMAVELTSMTDQQRRIIERQQADIDRHDRHILELLQEVERLDHQLAMLKQQQTAVVDFRLTPGGLS